MWTRLLAGAVCLCFAHSVHGLQQQLCGKSLPQTLALICNGCYNTRDKKYIPSSLDDDSLWEYASAPRPRKEADDLEELMETELQPSSPFRDRLRAADILGDTFRRFARGVADECCHKSCSLSEIVNYCCKPKNRRNF